MRLCPCIKAVGPTDAKILAIGEAPGEQEELTGIPFIGHSGQEFDRMLLQAGLKREELYLTNVLWTRPPDNKLEAFCVKKADLPQGYTFPPLGNGKYLHPEFLPELDRLYAEIRTVRPNLILVLGGTALWALTGTSKISAYRGTVIGSPFGKLLPTYHPAYILRDWSSRTIAVLDLKKAAVEKDFPEVIYPERFLTIFPTVAEVEAFVERALEASKVAIDTETEKGQITILGIAISATEAISIPFWDKRKDNWSYWTTDEEVRVRCLIQKLLGEPSVKKIFQNGMYDLQYLLREKFRPRTVSDDTMLMQHALWPELPKSLGFLGSIHANDMAWKMLRRRKTFKAEE